MVPDLFVGSNPIKGECVLSKFKLEEFNCLGEPPEDNKYGSYFSKLLLTVSRTFKCYLQAEGIKNWSWSSPCLVLGAQETRDGAWGGLTWVCCCSGTQEIIRSVRLPRRHLPLLSWPGEEVREVGGQLPLCLAPSPGCGVSSPLFGRAGSAGVVRAGLVRLGARTRGNMKM